MDIRCAADTLHFRILKFYSSEQKWVASENETLTHTNFRVVSRL